MLKQVYNNGKSEFSDKTISRKGYEKMKSKYKQKKILFIVLAIMAVLIIAGDWVLSVMVYNENFNQRFESYEPLMLYVDDFDGLHRTKYEFSSNEGQKLA